MRNLLTFVFVAVFARFVHEHTIARNRANVTYGALN
jgi:hypothetical protein